jgi:hypothetical protein
MAWLLAMASAQATTYYVSPTGSDSNAGTIDKPFHGFQKGADVAVAGDTVYFRGGTYSYAGQGSGTAAEGVLLTKSGSSDTKRIYFWAYPNEKPIFDFSQLTLSKTATCGGIRLNNANWLYFKGLEIEGVPEPGTVANNGIWSNPGSNNTYELLNIHNISGPGLSIANGTGGNLVLNCDSHDNYDATSAQGAGQNADGFGIHYQKSGPSTVLRGCRSWFNSDDGYDCIFQGVPVIWENCWAMRMGFHDHGTISAAQGNGNGFKAGGFGMPPNYGSYPSPIVHHVLRNCVSLLNKAAGFYQNHQPTSDTFYNNSSYDNGSDFDMLGYDIAAGAGAGYGYYRNNVAYLSNATANRTGTHYDDAFNSWTIAGLTVTASDFVTLDTAGIMGPRNADGSVPNVGFMRLSAASKLIDKGVAVGLPYSGKAPDLGAFEYGTVAIQPRILASQAGYSLGWRNGEMVFSTPGSESVTLSIHSVSGALLEQSEMTSKPGENVFPVRQHHPGLSIATLRTSSGSTLQMRVISAGT